jgi:hypothetical protein
MLQPSRPDIAGTTLTMHGTAKRGEGTFVPRGRYAPFGCLGALLFQMLLHCFREEQIPRRLQSRRVEPFVQMKGRIGLTRLADCD